MNSEEILIVEDDVIAQMALSQMLEDMGHKTVHISSNIDEATRIFENRKVSLVLLDVFLNGEREGISIAHLINRKYKVPIIFLTASHDKETFQLIEETEHAGVLEKPYDYDDIYNALDRTRNKRTNEITQLANHPFEFNTFFDAVPSSMCVLDKSKNIFKYNLAFFHQFQHLTKDKELKGTSIASILPQTASNYKSGKSIAEKYSWEESVAFPKGEFELSVSWTSFKSNNELFHLLTITDISLLKKNVRELEAQLDQNKKLRAEIQHRVGNSLNMVQGLLYVKEQKYDNEEVSLGFKKLRERIRILSRIHSLFFQKDFIEEISSSFLTKNVFEQINQGYWAFVTVDLEEKGEINLKNDIATKVGIALTELIMAFAGFNIKSVRLSIEFDEKEIRISIKSKETREPNQAFDRDQIGLQIIKQLCGKENVNFSSSKNFEISLKIKNYA